MTSVDSSLSAALKALSHKPVIPDAFKPDPEKAAAAKKIGDTLVQVAKATKNSSNEISKQRKAMAAQKVAMLKQMMKTLRQFAGAADPKTVARMAKQIARELQAAIKEYAAAGATFSEIAATAGAPDSGDAHASQNAAESAQNADAPKAEIAADAEPFAKEAQAYAKAAEDIPKGTQLSFDEKDDTIRVKDDDAVFMKDAKDMLDELKRIIKSLRPRLNADDKDGAKEVKQAEHALEDLEKEFDHLGKVLASSL